jgi:triacylglycerol lipase
VALPDHARGDLLAQARVLHIAVRTAMATSKATSVDVVGYSAGGVVARLWARDLGGAAVARRIVTLSSPQHGTQLASLGTLLPAACPTACQELATGSDLLAALNVGDATPPGPEWVSLWTTHDTVVLPPDSASLDGALDLTVQSLCPSDTVDHTGLPQDPVTIRVVLASLGRTLKRASPGC